MRPEKRGACMNGLRPCPWIGCRYHLIWETAEAAQMWGRYPGWSLPLGRSQARVWGKERWGDERIVDYLMHMPETCVLDVADEGGVTLETVAQIMGITKERVRQIEGGDSGRGGKTGIAKIAALPRLRAMLQEFSE